MEFWFARPLCRADLRHECQDDIQLIKSIVYEVPFKAAMAGCLFELKVGCKSFSEVGCISRDRLPRVEKVLRDLPDSVFGNHSIDDLCRKVTTARKRHRPLPTPDLPPPKRVTRRVRPITPPPPPPQETIDNLVPPPPSPETVDSLVPPEGLSLNDDKRCRYRGKTCRRQRAMKNNGKMHSLCDRHRAKANRNQRNMKRRHRSTSWSRAKITESIRDQQDGDKVFVGDAVFTVW